MPKFHSAINLTQNELENALIHVLDGAPVDPVEGQVYYDSTTQTPYIRVTDGWLPMHGANYRGEYNANVQYVRDDFVTYQGSTYIVTATPAGVGVIPTTDVNWDLLSEGGVSTYTNPTAMPVAVGGLPAGTSFDTVSLTNLLDRLLYPYQPPAFTSFSMSGQPAAVEVGTSLSGSKTFTWNSSNTANVVPGSVQISQGATVIASGLNASGTTSVTIPTVTNNSPATQTWTIRGTNTNGTNFQTSFNVAWQYKRYHGTSTNPDLDAAGVLALASNSTATGTAGNYAFAAGGYKYIAIPSSFPAIVSVKDQSTLLSVTMAGADQGYTQGTGDAPFKTVSITNGLGVTTNYRVYRSRYELGGAITFVVA